MGDEGPGDEVDACHQRRRLVGSLRRQSRSLVAFPVLRLPRARAIAVIEAARHRGGPSPHLPDPVLVAGKGRVTMAA